MTEKKIRREDARMKMEAEVHKLNEEYNQASQGDENEGELADRISTLSYYSLYACYQNCYLSKSE